MFSTRNVSLTALLLLLAAPLAAQADVPEVIGELESLIGQPITLEPGEAVAMIPPQPDGTGMMQMAVTVTMDTEMDMTGSTILQGVVGTIPPETPFLNTEGMLSKGTLSRWESRVMFPVDTDIEQLAVLANPSVALTTTYVIEDFYLGNDWQIDVSEDRLALAEELGIDVFQVSSDVYFPAYLAADDSHYFFFDTNYSPGIEMVHDTYVSTGMCETDTTITVVDVYSEEIIAYNDDSEMGDSLCSELSTILPDATPVVIQVQGFSSDDEGPYWFQFSSSMMEAGEIEGYSPSSPIALGSEGYTSGSIASAGQHVWYSHSVEPGQVYEVGTFSELDTYVEVYEFPFPSEDTYIGEDDDSGIDLNGSLTFVNGGADTILIKVRGYSSSVVGDFELYVMPLGDLDVISVGETMNLAFNDEEGLHQFKLELEPGQYRVFTENCESDTILAIFEDPNNTFVDSNDDVVPGENFCSSVTLSVVEFTSFRVEVEAYFDSQGTFDLSVERVSE